MNTFERKLRDNEFVGIVEDNRDPDKKQRVRIRVPYLHGEQSDIPTENLPWSEPHRDSNGLSFQVPDINKIVNVTFPSGNIYYPIYRNAQHLNINLQNKIEELGDEDYTKFVAFCYNHNTQMFVDAQTGINFIYKFNKVNIAETGINLQLKDNSSQINIGTENATEQAILGSAWMSFFDQFLTTLVAAVPEMAAMQGALQAQRQTILSRHIYLVGNDGVENTSFDVIGQIGDSVDYVTREGQVQTVNEPITYVPTEVAPPVVDNVTESIPENTDPVENTTSQTSSEKQKQAMLKAHQATFSKGSANPKGVCAKGVKNLVYNYFQALKDKDLFYTDFNNKWAFPGYISGDANVPSCWKVMTNRGYTQQNLGNNLTKAEIIEIITKKLQYNIGDVLVYWANDNPKDGGAGQYGHIQIYNGNVDGNNQLWSSDQRGNYNGSQFVYKKKSYTSWNLIYFKAPQV